jgi:hypothetical protein
MYCGESLPLHPDDLYVIDHTGYILGERQEVEFEIVQVPSEHDVTHGTFVVYKNYAKLINPQTVPLPVFQQLPTSVLEQDVVETMARDFYWKRKPEKLFAENSRPDMVIGYVEGYNKAKETLYTEEQVKELLYYYDLEIKKHLLSYPIEHSLHSKMCDGINDVRNTYIQSLKQPK